MRVATIFSILFVVATSTACSVSTDTSAAAPDADPQVQSDIGFPPKKTEWGFVVYRSAEGSFNMEVSQLAEPYLGRTIFDDLANRFSKVDGIDGVEHVDRDLFEIMSDGLSAEEVEERLWIVFVRAASDAYGPEH